MNPDNNNTRDITCTFLDSTVVTVAITTAEREVVHGVKDEIGRQTGNDPKLLTLLDPATCKRAHPWLTDTTAVTVIINSPPVRKLYRIYLDAWAIGTFSFLIQLAEGQDAEATIVLEWARNEIDNNTEIADADFQASIERNGAQKFECYAPGRADYWHIAFRQESEQGVDFHVHIVYIPSESKWYPLRIQDSNYDEDQVRKFSVAEVDRAELFEVTTA
jgi:hypothetical protein